LLEPREEGVAYSNLDKRKTLIFWASWLNSKGNDTIIRRLKSSFEMLPLGRHEWKVGIEEEPSAGGSLWRLTVNMCSKVAELSLEVVGTISNEEQR
jgi:hypothetical protein